MTTYQSIYGASEDQFEDFQTSRDLNLRLTIVIELLYVRVQFTLIVLQIQWSTLTFSEKTFSAISIS